MIIPSTSSTNFMWCTQNSGGARHSHPDVYFSIDMHTAVGGVCRTDFLFLGGGGNG